MNQIALLKEMVDRHIERLAGQEGWDGQLYAPMTYILSLKGKRIRPVLFLLTHRALGGTLSSAAVESALSLELFHNFTLMHDDIMDNAPVRRGQPTVHEKWDVNTAILSGDAMFAVSVDYLVRGFPSRASWMIPEFVRVSVGVCEGQMQDMLMSGNATVTVADYLEMIRKKTAMLLGGSMSLAALAAGVDPTIVRECYDLGEAAGIGFQLQDDYLDAFAPAEKLGKQRGGDIVEKKMTYLLIRALELADPVQKAELERLVFDEPDATRKIDGVLDLYERLGVRADTEQRIRAYFHKARAILRHLQKYYDMAEVEALLQSLQEREY